MDVSSDGKLLMTAADTNDDDVVLRLWDTETGGLKHQLAREGLINGRTRSDSEQAKPPVVRSVAFHPNQHHALVTVLIVAPPLEVSNQYLPVLGRIAQFSKEPDVPDRLLEITEPAQFLALLQEKGV
jgi:hypothetical protein